MSTTLSFILPVYNVEKTLAGQVRSLLELLAELGVSFELLIIDDGSIDDSLGEARDLERRFSQVRTIHRPLRYGHSAAVQLGLREAGSPFVMIHNDRSKRITNEIQRLWKDCLCPSSPDEAAATSSAGVDRAYGTVLEMGPLILVQRWELASVALLQSPASSFAGNAQARRWHEPSCDEEQVDRPYYLTPAAAKLHESVW